MADRPALIDLALLHAKHRWTKKRRNADLRRCGYNPDGQDGKMYRAHFERMCRSIAMAAAVSGMSEEADVTCLWDVPDEEWPAWVVHGCGDMPLSEYRERLEIVRNQVESVGGSVMMVPAKVGDVLRVIRELGMKNDPQGRATAVGLIGTKHQKHKENEK